MKMPLFDRFISGFCPHARLIAVTLAALAAGGATLSAQDTNAATVIPSPEAMPAPVPDVPADATTPETAPSTSVAASLNTMNSLNDKAKLGNGDRISYRVTEEQKDPIVLVVSDSGELTIPLVGRVTAAGKTCKELAYELKPILEKEFFYHATVIVGVETFSTHPKGTVYLTGQVARQGAVEIPAAENLTVSQAIVLDGGLADFADKRRIKLQRKKTDGTTETTTVDIVEILEKGHAEKDPVLQAGDVIYVPQRLINF